MKEEKVINKIDSLILQFKRAGLSPISVTITEEDVPLLITSIGALSKRIPRQIIDSNRTYDRFICPICKRIVVPFYRYCNNCGQRIDWRY